ncbi:MAG TPA: YihY/virulence factor BrkB family protein, partial [Longimicrobiales bacterium]
YVHQTFGGNQALIQAIEQILHFVDRTNVSTLGVLGLLVLVYTSVSLLSSVEDAFNETWGAQARRSFLRQLTNYVTLLVTTPLLVLVAATFATAAQSSTVVLFLRNTLALGSVLEFLLRFTSAAVVWIALFAMYVILPNVHVRIPSALLGGAVSAILWQVALVLYVQLQTGVAAYSALYSALGAVPIFLVWTYVSWVIVLVGAQVAASHQGQRAMRQRFELGRADQAVKETVAVLVAARVARDFLSAAPPPSEAALAVALDVPEPLVREVVDALARWRLLARTTGSPPACVPARDPGGIRVQEVQDAVRQDERAAKLREQIWRGAPSEVARLLRERSEETRRSEHNVTLRRLAEMMGGEPGGAPV